MLLYPRTVTQWNEHTQELMAVTTLACFKSGFASHLKNCPPPPFFLPPPFSLPNTHFTATWTFCSYSTPPTLPVLLLSTENKAIIKNFAIFLYLAFKRREIAITWILTRLYSYVCALHATTQVSLLMMSWCLMSSDVMRHVRDKLWPMPKHGSIILYVHGNQKAR